MVSAIVVQQGASSRHLESLVSSILASGIDDVTVISQDACFNSKVNTIVVDRKSTKEALERAFELAKNEALVLFDGRINPSSELLTEISSKAAQLHADQTVYAAVSDDTILVDIENQGCEHLVSELTPPSYWPMGCALSSKAGWKSVDFSDWATLITRRIIDSIAANGQLEQFSFPAPPALGTAVDDICELPSNSIASILTHVVSSFNIEELFPQHDWESHEGESAAAAYHTLAALFVRLEDLDSALNCLGISDGLEDSPRSQALKGLIAKKRGEPLAAVANMVSSLQQYEERKKSNGNEHYITFAPSNLEVINESLQAGLEALNERDNDTAMEHFAEAIFNFDPFYRDCGVTERD